MTGIYRIYRTCLLLAPFVFLAAMLAETANPTDAIVSALSNHEFEKALALLRPALQASPQDGRLWSMQATAYVGQGDKRQALASFRHALLISPDYPPALQGAAQIEYEAGSSAAVPFLQRLLRLRPDDQVSHGMLAVLEYQQGNCKLAIPHFEKAGALFDSRADGLHAYATCLMRLRRFNQAATILERAVALNPNDRRERQVLASIQLMAHQPQAAITTLESVLQSNPDAGTLELAATAHEDLQETPQAVGMLRQGILLDPKNVNLYVDFALISAAHQSAGVGINVVSDGITQQPNAAPLYVARGVLYAQLDQYDKAEADFEKAYDLDPNQSLSTAAQGLAAMQKNDLDSALTSVQERLVRKPNDPSLLYLQGDILAQKGAAPGSPEFETAMRSARKAVSLQPTLAPAHGVLAKLYLRAGQYRAAAGECREALKIDPKDQTALYRLIQALRKTRDNSEMPALLKRLAALRAQTTKEERERNRYRLADDDTPAAPPSHP